MLRKASGLFPTETLYFWVRESRPSGGKTAAAILRAGLQAMQSGQFLREGISYLSNLSDVSDIYFDNLCYLAVSKVMFVNVLILVVAILRQT